MLRALALLACGALAACASPRTSIPAGAVPQAAAVDGVPFFAREDKHCGPAALAMVLAWSGLEIAPPDVAPLLFTPERGGTFQHDLLAGARRHGRLAAEIEQPSDLLTEVAAGNPVLVLQNLGLGWHPVWHYAVLTGYDLPPRQLVLHSGRERDRVMSLDTFEHTWARAGQWGLVVLPPGRLPASAEEHQVLEAAAGLERAGQPGAAIATYSAILERWPMSEGALNRPRQRKLCLGRSRGGGAGATACDPPPSRCGRSLEQSCLRAGRAGLPPAGAGRGPDGCRARRPAREAKSGHAARDRCIRRRLSRPAAAAKPTRLDALSDRPYMRGHVRDRRKQASPKGT